MYHPKKMTQKQKRRFNILCSDVRVYKIMPDGTKVLDRIDNKVGNKRTFVRDKRYIGESGMKKLLDTLFPTYTPIDNYRPKWLTNPKTGFPLELDRYYPELRLGFEYQGEQHFTYKSKYGKEYQAQRARDDIKKRLANKYGVRIVYCTNRSLAEDTLKRKIYRAEQKLLARTGLAPAPARCE